MKKITVIWKTNVKNEENSMKWWQCERKWRKPIIINDVLMKEKP
jgi:hypothetical protein